MTKAEVTLAVEPNGNLVCNIVDKGKEVVEWQRIEHERIDVGVPVRLGIEVIDYDQGMIRLTVDGEPAMNEDLVVKNLKKNTRNLILGIYASAPGSRKVQMTADNVKVVIRN